VWPLLLRLISKHWFILPFTLRWLCSTILFRYLIERISIRLSMCSLFQSPTLIWCSANALKWLPSITTFSGIPCWPVAFWKKALAAFSSHLSRSRKSITYCTYQRPDSNISIGLWRWYRSRPSATKTWRAFSLVGHDIPIRGHIWWPSGSRLNDQHWCHVLHRFLQFHGNSICKKDSTEPIEGWYLTENVVLKNWGHRVRSGE